ncbi:MAG: HNH endonuclease [Chloroflexota bacterium]|nr:HNH endonuclease [Chloroflexota bacterium]
MKKTKHKIINDIELKQCCVCKKWLFLGYFNKDKSKCDGLRSQCKNCVKQYCKDNREQIAERNKQYRKNNRKQIAERNKQYRKNNRKRIAEKAKQYYQDNSEQIKQYRKDNCEQMKQYYKNSREQIKQHYRSFALHDTYIRRIGFCEEVRRVFDNPELLEVKCAYCGKWMKPTNLQIKNRLQTLNGTQSGENRFYCSENCKEVCPIFNQNKYPKGFKQATSREVIPLLRQLVLKRDNYTCQKCGATTETAQLHVHHIIPYAQNKMQANDPDSCITLCKSCHKEVHQQDGCKTSDLKCQQM